MEKLLTNPGLCHIVRNISSFLDPKSLAQCRVVCHSLKDLIDNDRQWLIFQLEHIHKQEKTFIDYDEEDKEERVKSSIKTRFPEWNAFVEEVSRRQNIPTLKEFVKYMWIYFKDKPRNCFSNPLHSAIENSNIEFTQLLINSGIDLEMKNPFGGTPLHIACVHGKMDSFD